MNLPGARAVSLIPMCHLQVDWDMPLPRRVLPIVWCQLELAVDSNNQGCPNVRHNFKNRLCVASPPPPNPGSSVVTMYNFRLVWTVYWTLPIVRCLFIVTTVLVRSRDSAVCIVTGYGLDSRGAGVRVPAGQEFSLLYVVQTGSGAHTASYPRGTAALSQE
jgi:hypothetical protein